MARQPTTSRKRPSVSPSDPVIDLRHEADPGAVPSDLLALGRALDDGIDRLLLPLDLVALDPPGPERSLDEGDVRLQLWSQILASLQALDERAAYVGSFRRRIDDSRHLAERLTPEDRRAAALLFVDRTARFAANDPEFRHGIVRARELDPTAFSPRVVVSTVLRACLRHRHEPPRPPATTYGLPVTLELLSGSPRPAIDMHDKFAVRAALSQLTPDRVATLPRLAERLHPDDRRFVEGLLFGEPPGRRWSLRRRRHRTTY
jgi:hypothetical protein